MEQQMTEQEMFERKVIHAFTDAEGRITFLPAKEKKLIVLLHYAAKAFEPGKRYSEQQVNEILLNFNPDTASLRRAMVDHNIMARKSAGTEYWLADPAGDHA